MVKPRLWLSICAAATLAGCGGIAPLATPNSLAPARSAVLSGVDGQDLLYISDAGSNHVYVYALPSRKLTQTLSGFDEPQGECSDAAGNVFITNTQKSEIVEYAHGGTQPIQRLKDQGYYPVGCAVDGSTGNLAVTNLFATKNKYGSVAIFKNASGSPTQYTDSSIYYYYFCGYDDAGNLYLDGYTPDSTFAFALLPSGSGTFLNIALNQPIYFPGTVQWTGKWVMVGDQQDRQSNESVLYEFKIRGSIGYLENFTALNEATDVVQAWLQGKTVYAPDAERADVGLYHYVAGGNPFNTIAGLSSPVGATVSVASSRLRRTAYAAAHGDY